MACQTPELAAVWSGKSLDRKAARQGRPGPCYHSSHSGKIECSGREERAARVHRRHGPAHGRLGSASQHRPRLRLSPPPRRAGQPGPDGRRSRDREERSQRRHPAAGAVRDGPCQRSARQPEGALRGSLQRGRHLRGPQRPSRQAPEDVPGRRGRGLAGGAPPARGDVGCRRATAARDAVAAAADPGGEMKVTSAIRTEKLTKDYGSGRGLFDLDLEVAEGEVFGYLGPNGAGKSTTIRLLMGLIHPNRGSAEIFGLDCRRQALEVKRKLGYVPGEHPDFGGLRGREVVAYLGAMGGGVDQAWVKALCERLKLDLSQRFRDYSSGNKQKLLLVLAFLHKPPLLILDEPTSGLDPLNQQEFYTMVREARDQGTTVFLSSHILSEVEHVCDRVGIIRAGSLVRVASLAELHDIRLHRVEIEFAGELPLDRIRAAEGVSDVTIEDHSLRCIVRGSFAPLLAVLAGAQVVNLSSHEPTLEETFLEYYAAEPKEPVAC